MTSGDALLESQRVTVRRLSMIAMAGPVVFVVIVALLTALEWGFLLHLGWDPIRSGRPLAEQRGPR